MFTRNKRNYRTFIFSAVIVTLCLLVIALAWPAEPVETGQTGQGPTLPAGTEEKAGDTVKTEGSGTGETAGTQQEVSGNENFAGENQSEESNMTSQSTSYYLVKKAGEQIAVFFCDGQGNMVQLETTEILYDLLGPEDQKLFEEGIPVKSQEELSVLLQDFES